MKEVIDNWEGANFFEISNIQQLDEKIKNGKIDLSSVNTDGYFLLHRAIYAGKEDLVKYLLNEFESNPQGIWETEMFGKSLHSLVNEGLNNKLTAMPLEVQKKMRKTLGRIVNEGKGGVICILL